MRVLIIVAALFGGSAVAASEAVFSDPESAKLNMSQFDLTEAEAVRSEKLRLIDVSFGVTNLSPVELLGKYAETEEERLTYARKHVMAAADNVGRSQAWALAVYEVSQEQNMLAAVLSTNPAIKAGLAKLNMAPPDNDWAGYDRESVPPGPKRTLFVSLDCGDQCVDSFLVQKAKVEKQTVSALDVVFVGSTSLNEVSIFDWAKAAGVTYEALESGALNLHIDSEEWRTFRHHRNDVPRVVR